MRIWHYGWFFKKNILWAAMSGIHSSAFSGSKAMSQNNFFVLQIKGHNMTVIATDGNPIEPITIETLVILPGERYDVVMDATTSPDISNFQRSHASFTICIWQIMFFFTAETLITVRALFFCAQFKLQEFARIVFVDNIHNHTAKLEDHEPLKQRPAFESLDHPKTVRELKIPPVQCDYEYFWLNRIPCF